MEVAQIWWWREGSCGSLLPGRGPRFDPQSTGVLPAQRSECSAAEQSMGLATPHHHHHPPEDDRCSVRSLQQGESIRHLYNWLRMREKKGKRDGKESKKQGDRLRGCVFALEWDIGAQSVCVCVCVCESVFFSCSVRVRKRNGRYYRDRKDTREGKWEKRSGRKGRGAGRGRELAQTRLALTQQDILSHTLHMSSPILSQNRHWSGSVGKKKKKKKKKQGPTLLTDETTGMSWWGGAAPAKDY